MPLYHVSKKLQLPPINLRLGHNSTARSVLTLFRPKSELPAQLALRVSTFLNLDRCQAHMNP
jgi:hypothetical protein